MRANFASMCEQSHNNSLARRDAAKGGPMRACVQCMVLFMYICTYMRAEDVKDAPLDTRMSSLPHQFVVENMCVCKCPPFLTIHI